MLSETDVIDIFKSVNAILTDDHIVYASGKHGSAYLNKDAIYPHTELISKLCFEFALRFQNDDVNVVAGPTIGGVVLSQWTAHHLTKLTGKEVLAVFAEEDAQKNRLFKRGYDAFISHKNVLIVEDIINTGGSVKKVVEEVKRLQGRVIGVGALANRGGVTSQMLGGVDITSLANIQLSVFDSTACPLCSAGVPINTHVGKGAEFLAAQLSN